MCGELGHQTRNPATSPGSSPRVRGTRRTAWYALPPVTVHPRVCGELGLAVDVQRNQRGSSPRVRGTRRTRHQHPARVRFIPACAGNSRRAFDRRIVGPVHPRVCGELQPLRIARHPFSGSSPRVRGTLEMLSATLYHHRFIPACAGNSSSAAPRLPRGTVHPRVCGELLKRIDRGIVMDGSSPRVRGTPLGTPQAG